MTLRNQVKKRKEMKRKEKKRKEKNRISPLSPFLSVQQFIGIYSVIFPSFLANFLALLLVVVSQIKINVFFFFFFSILFY